MRIEVGAGHGYIPEIGVANELALEEIPARAFKHEAACSEQEQDPRSARSSAAGTLG